MPRTQKLFSHPCRHCGRLKARTANDLCSACREYKRRHGVERPYGKEMGNRRHGHRCSNDNTSPTYRSWCSMLHRCLNSHASDYFRYGGRGIEVCEQWQESFATFLADMGERPIGRTLDRIDNNGNYEPGNCRWATNQEQTNNKRNLVLLCFDNRTQSIAGWARDLGWSESCIRERLARGLSIETTLTIPLIPCSERPKYHKRKGI